METMQNGDELVFLYQLVDGYTNTSYACHIAALAGISSDLVQRGHEVCMCVCMCVLLNCYVFVSTCGWLHEYKLCMSHFCFSWYFE